MKIGRVGGLGFSVRVDFSDCSSRYDQHGGSVSDRATELGNAADPDDDGQMVDVEGTLPGSVISSRL
ncbi:hypothetical protein [Stieleria varia]|uniref:hypothetical protein n=1 Tax=Stieleria varia TaxID=2528005 RepID=UPI0011B673C0|nr:hypothetical protein [Stieleria varia]